MFQATARDLLLVIDMQEGFRSKATESITPNLLELLQVFPGKVVLSLFVNEKGSLFETELSWTDFQAADQQALLPEFQELDFPRFWHSGYTVLTPEITDLIEAERLETIYLAGIFTDVCIVKTAMDVFDFGHRPVVVADCVNTLHGEDVHQATLKSLKFSIGWQNVIPFKD